MKIAREAIVVGAGFSGIACAALLAAKGFDVLVLEKNSSPGGRAQVYEADGFRFDMGPSWYLMPEIFDRFFAEFNRQSADFYELIRLSPSYRIYFGPDDPVDVSDDLQTNIELFERIEPGAGGKLKQYLDIAAVQYRAAVDEFLYRDYRTLLDFFNKRTLLEGRKLHVFESLNRYAARFFSSERLRRILCYSTVFLGGSPQNTPAMYSLLAHVDFNLGVWYPRGGIGVVVDALRKLAESLGVKFLFNHEVRRIEASKGVATAAHTDKGAFSGEVFVVAADYAHSELELIEPQFRSYSRRYWQRRVMAPSAFMMYLGLRKRIDRLQHHTLSFEHDWMEHFDSIFQSPGWPRKPSYYVCCPTRSDASVAPAGCENIVVLVPMACGIDDTDDERERFADQVMTAMERLVGEPLRDLTISQTLFGPRDFASVFNAFKGSALGLSHTLTQSAVFRPKHRSRRLKNLFYTGQYTHPGIGLPMTLISASITAEIAAREHGNGLR